MNSTRRGWLSDAILRKFYPCLSSFFGLDKQKSTIKSDQVSKWLATFVPGVLDISEVANIRMTRKLNLAKLTEKQRRKLLAWKPTVEKAKNPCETTKKSHPGKQQFAV